MKDQNIANAARPGRAPPTRSQTNVPRILVVEDDLAIRQLSAEALTSSGYQVETAEDGAAGWEALQGSNYDLLITDNNMPRVSGVELVKILRSARMTLPVVMASGTPPAEALNGDSSLQLAATLLKPFTMDELLRTVEKVLRATEVSPGHMETKIAEKVLAVVGFAEMTAANSKLFRKRVCAALNGHTEVEIDLSQTTFMDCTGLGALIAIRSPARGRKIAVRLINPTLRVQQLLHVMRAGEVLEIVNRHEVTMPTIPLVEATPGKIRPRVLLASEGTTAAEEGLAPAMS
jgi:anti-anti-sigma factor